MPVTQRKRSKSSLLSVKANNLLIDALFLSKKKTANFHSLLFRSYNVLEGEELALICQDINNRQNNKIAWRRKVSAVLPFIEINTANIRLLFGILRQLEF